MTNETFYSTRRSRVRNMHYLFYTTPLSIPIFGLADFNLKPGLSILLLPAIAETTVQHKVTLHRARRKQCSVTYTAPRAWQHILGGIIHGMQSMIHQSDGRDFEGCCIKQNIPLTQGSFWKHGKSVHILSTRADVSVCSAVIIIFLLRENVSCRSCSRCAITVCVMLVFPCAVNSF